MTPEFAAEPRTAPIRVLTRKLHNYLGLYLLFFLWLFAVSGLIINHTKWPAAQFWKVRQESTTVRPLVVPAESGDVAIASELMRQFVIIGEIGEIKRSPGGERFDFQVVKPGRVYRVEARLDSAHARVTETRLNAWGVIDALHKFTGVKMGDPTVKRDWLLTRIWSLAMDAVAVGIVVLVLSGLYLWLRLTEKRRLGLLAIASGVACCAFFLFGLGALVT
jgi:hypothetical protein